MRPNLRRHHAAIGDAGWHEILAAGVRAVLGSCRFGDRGQCLVRSREKTVMAYRYANLISDGYYLTAAKQSMSPCHPWHEGIRR